MNYKKANGISSLQIKYFAMAVMLLDHIGAAVLPHVSAQCEAITTCYSILRVIGRAAFPLFCFLLVEGFSHTKDKKKYIARLTLFAWLSEFPFDLALFSSPVYMQDQNVFFTLAIGFLCIWGHSLCTEYLSVHVKNHAVHTACSCASFAVILFTGMYVTDFLHTDYKFGGIMAIMAIYACRKFPYTIQCMAGCCMLILYNPSFEIPALLAVPIVALYNGKLYNKTTRSETITKWIPYLFYPCHLLCLACIRTMLSAWF